MSADAIAAVIADLRDGRVRHVLDDAELNRAAVRSARDLTVVDSTTIYSSLVERNKPVWIYEDHSNIAPSLESAAFCYVNEHGNVIVLQATARDSCDQEWWKSESNEIEWSRVRWVVETFLYLGGTSVISGPFPTTGPMHLWRFAVYENGEPADLRWCHLFPKIPLENWDMANLVLLGSMNFLACRNVRLVVPSRPRAQRRRLMKLGVSVNTINVFPVGKTYSGSGNRTGEGTPLSSVRGHFASYGEAYGRGLLFGKLAGRFWIPQHVRGTVEHGRSTAEYRLRADVSEGDVSEDGRTE